MDHHELDAAYDEVNNRDEFNNSTWLWNGCTPPSYADLMPDDEWDVGVPVCSAASSYCSAPSSYGSTLDRFSDEQNVQVPIPTFNEGSRFIRKEDSKELPRPLAWSSGKRSRITRLMGGAQLKGCIPGLFQEPDSCHFEEHDACLRGQMSKSRRTTLFIEATSALTSEGCALLLAEYGEALARRSGHFRHGQGRIFETGLRLLSSRIRIFQDPSPGVVAAAVLLYSVNVSILFCLHRHDKHINKWLAAGVCIALTLGLLDTLDVCHLLYGLLPGCVVVSLLASAGFHRCGLAGTAKMGAEIQGCGTPCSAKCGHEKDAV